MTDQLPECTCPLIDTSTWGGKPSFHRGNPRGSGCPIHETQAMRDEVRIAEARARYGEVLSGLKDTTFTFNGTFESGTRAGQFFRDAGFTPITQVSIEIPASRWQAFKARLKRIRGLGWIPVRYAWKTQFVGHMEPWPNGDGFTISTNPEETAP